MPLAVSLHNSPVPLWFRMLNVSGWKISKELTDLLANGVAGQCSEKVSYLLFRIDCGFYSPFTHTPDPYQCYCVSAYGDIVGHAFLERD